MGDEPNTDGEGYTQVVVNLKDETVRHILTGQPLTTNEYAELVGEFIRSTGAV